MLLQIRLAECVKWITEERAGRKATVTIQQPEPEEASRLIRPAGRREDAFPRLRQVLCPREPHLGGNGAQSVPRLHPAIHAEL